MGRPRLCNADGTSAREQRCQHGAPLAGQLVARRTGLALNEAAHQHVLRSCVRDAGRLPARVEIGQKKLADPISGTFGPIERVSGLPRRQWNKAIAPTAHRDTAPRQAARRARRDLAIGN
jgi:hypothetical protein